MLPRTAAPISAGPLKTASEPSSFPSHHPVARGKAFLTALRVVQTIKIQQGPPPDVRENIGIAYRLQRWEIAVGVAQRTTEPAPRPRRDERDKRDGSAFCPSPALKTIAPVPSIPEGVRARVLLP